MCARFVAIFDSGFRPRWLHTLASSVRCYDVGESIAPYPGRGVLLSVLNRGEFDIDVADDFAQGDAEGKCSLLRFSEAPGDPVEPSARLGEIRLPGRGQFC